MPTPSPSVRPATAPDFLLSRPLGSVRTQGARRTFTEVEQAVAALRRGEAEMVVGALPFEKNDPAALTVPETIIREPGALKPHPYYLEGPGSHLQARVTGLDPAPTEHLRRVEAAVATIQQSSLDKVVLARAVDIAFDEPVDARLVAARLIGLARGGNGFIADLSSAGRPGHMLVGASPEVLVRRSGTTVSAYPLAGSAARNAMDPAADEAAGFTLAHSEKDLAEHAFVVDHIRELLAPLCSSLDVPSAPNLEKTSEMWHLATPITGTLKTSPARPAPSALELAALLHPTPAVCGTPSNAAEALITTAETARGFYAGAVGYTEANGDGEYVVAIRCAEVSGDGKTARAWAGGGLVADSDPEAELQETSAKLRTIMRALGL